ncbi:MAG: ABC transporter ATP-binding protein [Pseudolabrys sp.]|nr:ABC transporter ATP-binding protein [Pseudolabrys sp.]
MSYLSLQNLRKHYGGKTFAVDDVSLDIEKGEFVTFLGPSGSGKTTTLMMIAGFEQPTSGHIALAGRAIDPVPPHKRNIGVVFQNYALFPHMSVARNVGFPLRMRGVPKAEIAARVAKMLAIVELGAFADAEPRRLSGGQQQRVALARALVFEPDVLLLDEPLGALDKNLREQMQIEIRRIHRELGVTTIYVTHDQTEAMTMSDRIVVFNGGKVEQVDAPLALYRRPNTPFVAGFVGDNNVLDATHAGGGRIELPGIGPIAAALPSGCPTGPLKIALRPESIRLATASDAPAFAVQGIVNYGDSVVLVGALGTVPLKIRLPAVAASNLTVGQTLRIEWSPDAVHVIGASAG